MRPDAHLYVRPDAYRYMPPGAPRWYGKDAAKYFWSESTDDQSHRADEGDAVVDRSSELQLAADRDDLLRLKSNLLLLKLELKFRRLLRALKYRPDQPRVPAGNPDGGQWTTEEGGGGIPDRDVISDESPDPIMPGAQYAAASDGHHHVPRGVFENKEYSFRPETLKIFEDAKTGALGDPSSNRFDRMHRELSDAVKEAMDRYLQRNKIISSQMTPAQAQEFVKEVKSSSDPRIKNFYNRMLYREWRFWFRRVPRGID